jgi:hypothetical protein
MGAGVYAAGLGLPAAWPNWLVTLLKVLLGMGLYAALAHGSNLSAYREVRTLVAERIARSSDPTPPA